MNFSGVRYLFFFLLTLFFFPLKGEEKKDYLQNPMPEKWQMEAAYYQTLPVDDQWWQNFNDPVLTQLISLAVKNNFNVASAIKSIGMAKQAIRQAASSYYPQLTANLGWDKSREAGAMRGGADIDMSYFSLAATMSWEIDVFGKIYQNVKAKKMAYNVSKADYDAVMVSLCANLATTYMQLRTYQEELRVAKEHIESQKYVCKITESRYNAGLGSLLDVTQAKVVLYQTESTLPNLEANVKVMKNSLSLLVGSYPGSLDELLDNDITFPVYAMNISLGMPADLLRRRPDIIESEMTLAEYAAEIGIAKKDFLPTLSISGSIGTYSHELKGLFGKHSLNFEIAPQLSWTIFEGFARNAALAESRFQFESAIDQYNLTVTTAMEEVDNAMIDYSAYLEAIELQKRVVEESKKSMDLSFELYRSGLTMFSNVVDGQIDWLTSQNTLITMQGNALSSLISLYQALGGGWQTAVMMREEAEKD